MIKGFMLYGEAHGTGHYFLIRLIIGNNTRCPIIINPSFSLFMLQSVKTPISVDLKS